MEAPDLKTLAKTFAHDQTQAKFAALDLLTYFLLSIRDSEAEDTLIQQAKQNLATTDDKQGSTWPDNARAGLTSVLSTRVGSDQRKSCLSLAALLLDWFGPSWILPPNTTKPGQTLELLLQVCRIEIVMAIDDDIERDANAPSLETSEQLQQIILSCYEIVEKAINYLTLEDGEHTALAQIPCDDLLRMFSIVNDIVSVVLRFVHREKDTNDTSLQLFLKASARLIGTWLSQDSDSLRTEVYAVLPFLVHTANASLQDNNISLVEVLVSGFRLFVESDGVDEFVQAKGPEMIRQAISKIDRSQEPHIIQESQEILDIIRSASNH